MSAQDVLRNQLVTHGFNPTISNHVLHALTQCHTIPTLIDTLGETQPLTRQEVTQALATLSQWFMYGNKKVTFNHFNIDTYILRTAENTIATTFGQHPTFSTIPQLLDWIYLDHTDITTLTATEIRDALDDLDDFTSYYTHLAVLEKTMGKGLTGIFFWLTSALLENNEAAHEFNTTHHNILTTLINN